MRLRFRVLASLLAVAILPLALDGCAGSAAPGASVMAAPIPALSASVRIEVDGAPRLFLVRSPEHATGELLPVLIALHSAGGSAQGFERTTHFTDAVEAERVIVVYPQGSPQSPGHWAWNAGNCCGKPQARNTDDIGFLRVLIAALEHGYDADPERVFLAGLSNGGMLAYRAACDLGSSIAGIAVVAGALDLATCHSARPMPLVIIHGTADTVVPYDGGPPRSVSKLGLQPWVNASVAQALATWLVRDRCDATGVLVSIPHVQETVYRDCAPGSFIDVYTIAGGAHVWPSASSDLDASRVILKALLG